MGQEVRTGLGHGGITCVLQTQFSIYLFIYFLILGKFLNFNFGQVLELKTIGVINLNDILVISFSNFERFLNSEVMRMAYLSK